MKTEDFDFNAESSVMPSDPVELRGKRREDGRMVVLERSTETIRHTNEHHGTQNEVICQSP